MKTVTVIIPAYMSHKFLDDCLKSIIKQKLPEDWSSRIFVGIDGCESTLDYVRSNHYADVNYFYSHKNVGAYVIRNSLINQAYYISDAFALFDADDQMLSGYLQKTLNRIENGSQFVITAKYQCDAIMNRMRSRYQNGGAMTFTKNVVNVIGHFRGYRCAGDSDYMDRAKIAGFTIDIIRDPLYLRRLHQNALTRRSETCYGSAYRKSAWAEMTAMRENGKIYGEKVICDLEAV